MSLEQWAVSKRRQKMNEIKVNEKTNELNKKIHELGFDSESEYKLYLQIKESLKQKIVIGIAS